MRHNFTMPDRNKPGQDAVQSAAVVYDILVTGDTAPRPAHFSKAGHRWGCTGLWFFETMKALKWTFIVKPVKIVGRVNKGKTL